MRKLLAGFVMAATLCGPGHAADVPRFKDYPAKIYSGRQAPLRLDTAEAQEHRTRLEEAEKDQINFGGRYVFTHWGAGTQCDTGALIDVATGQVHILPFAACFWSGYERPFEVRPGSRLMVVAGQVGEDGPRGAHFFEFTGTEFRKVGMVPADPVTADNVKPVGQSAEPSLASLEPGAGPLSREEKIAAIKNDPEVGPLLQCYDAALKEGLSTLAQNSGDEREYTLKVMLAGGISRMGHDVLEACNKWYAANPKITGNKQVNMAGFGKVFMSIVMEEERAFTQDCLKHENEPSWKGLIPLCRKFVLN